MGVSKQERHGKELGSPNKVPWALCGMLRRLSMDSAPDPQRDLIEQDGLVAVFLAINAIETFVNIFFRVVAEQAEFANVRERILKDLHNRRLPLHSKLRGWPKYAFGQTIDEDDPRWRDFLNLRDRRNGFTHFRSTHETIVLSSNVTINGLVDLHLFRELNEDTPRYSLQCVRGIVEAIGECAGTPTERLPAFIHLWLGLLD
jgi:hypothetical protein